MFGQLEKILITVEDETTGEILNEVTCESKSPQALAFAWKGAVAPYQHLQVAEDLKFKVNVTFPNNEIAKYIEQTLVEIESHIQKAGR